MKPYLLTTLSLMMLGMATSLASAQISDITVNNGLGSTSSSFSAISGNSTNADTRVVGGKSVLALGYVNLNDVAEKQWDLESFGYNATTHQLTYVGGFNPLTTIADSGHNFSLGDIFISLPNASLPTPPNTNGTDSTYRASTTYSNSVNGKAGYSYAIHFSAGTGSTLNYAIYGLSSSSQLLTVTYNTYYNNGASDPYALVLNTGTVLSSGSTTVSALTNAQVNSQLFPGLFSTAAVSGDASADNYAASFDLSSILSGVSGIANGFTAHLTEQCGNDLLVGSYLAPGNQLMTTPEPAALLNGFFAVLVGIGLVLAKRRSLDAQQN